MGNKLLQATEPHEERQLTEFMLKQLEIKSRILENLALRRDQTLQVTAATVSALLGAILLVASTTSNPTVLAVSWPILTLTTGCIMLVAFSRYTRHNRMNQIERAKLNYVYEYFASFSPKIAETYGINREIVRFDGSEISIAIGERSMALLFGLVVPPIVLGLTIPLSIMAYWIITVQKSMTSENIFLLFVLMLLSCSICFFAHLTHFVSANKRAVKEIQRIVRSGPD